MSIVNEVKMDFLACPQNEGFARMAVSAFILPLNPTIEQMGDVKTSVSEAVTNAVVHAYGGRGGTIRLHATLSEGGELVVDIVDNGIGIDNVARARQPFYSSDDGGERSGMGFTVMESFMDDVSVWSEPGKGTTVRLRKQILEGNVELLARHA